MAEKKLGNSDLTEALLAKIIAVYFKQKGWDLFPEVVLQWFSGRPDYVGVKGELVSAIECKKSLSYEVFEQLFRWRHFFDNTAHLEAVKGIPHLLIAATFRAKNGQLSDFKAHLLKSNRFGYLSVSYDGPSFRNEGCALKIISQYDDHMSFTLDGHDWTVREEVSPKIQFGSRQTAARIINHLDQDMKRATAGVSGKVGANYSTPFRRTLMKAVAVLEEHGECHIQHIVKHINQSHGGHHYSNDASARGSIAKFLREFQIAESVGGLPKFKLLPDYKDRLYSSETETQRIIKERKAAREQAKANARELTRIAGSLPFWEN